jgi:hypothetical protein
MGVHPHAKEAHGVVVGADKQVENRRLRDHPREAYHRSSGWTLGEDVKPETEGRWTDVWAFIKAIAESRLRRLRARPENVRSRGSPQ